MIIEMPPTPPPRDLEEALLTHGGHLLTLTVLRQAGVRKDGEIRYRRHTNVYAVEKGQDTVRLVKADGKIVTVTRFGCDCEDAQFKGRERL